MYNILCEPMYRILYNAIIELSISILLTINKHEGWKKFDFGDNYEVTKRLVLCDAKSIFTKISEK